MQRVRGNRRSHGERLSHGCSGLNCIHTRLYNAGLNNFSCPGIFSDRRVFRSSASSLFQIPQRFGIPRQHRKSVDLVSQRLTSDTRVSDQAEQLKTIPLTIECETCAPRFLVRFQQLQQMCCGEFLQIAHPAQTEHDCHVLFIL